MSNLNNYTEVKEAIKKTAGKFFRVVFQKADGTERVMIARTGVSKFVKGTGYALKTDLVLRVFDIQKMEYRTIPLDRVFSIKCGSLNYAF